MKILIKKVRVIAEGSTFHNQKLDILVENGTIKEIGFYDGKADEIITSDNLCLSAGWVDGAVHYKDPGAEWLESLDSLQQSAIKGGFTSIVGFPNTQPTVQTKESLAYFQNFSKSGPVSFLNYAAITKNCEGKDFTDMMDLHYGGAVGFSDGKNPLQSSDILLKTLQYLQPLNTILVNKAEDKYLSLFGQMHEGVSSTMLGLKGIPSAAEEIMIMRDLKLLEYSGIKTEKPLLHFSTISTKESVSLIREAKRKGLPVSCDIAAHQLAFIDSDMFDFDTNLKVSPPFRSKSDIKALLKGLEDDTIDMIVSDHHPLDAEHKNVEFDVADFGVIGIQTMFSVIRTYSDLSIEKIIDKISIRPRKLLNLKECNISVGTLADMTIFDSDIESEFSLNDIFSKSKNSPFIGKKLKGKVMATFKNGHFNKN